MYWCIVFLVAAVVVEITAWCYRKEQTVRIYCVILAASSIWGILVCVGDRQNGETQSIVRGAPGKGSFETSYVIEVDDLNLSENYAVTVENRHMDEEDKEKIFTQAIEEATSIFLGNNTGFDHVDHDLVLVSSVCDGLVNVKWNFDNYRAVDINGKLAEDLPEEGVIVAVTADLSYETSHTEHEFPILVFPAKLTPVEQFYDSLEKSLEKANGELGEKLQLPESVDGHQIRWSKPKNQLPHFLLLLGIGGCMAIAIGKKTDEKKLRKSRLDQLSEEFPQMLSQMSLLLSAGMTVSHAWGKIVRNYERGICEANALRQPVYEEMVITWRQIQDGIGEREAYEKFGQRIGLQCYRKFSNLLSQNLRKGTTGLSTLLEKEVENAFADQESQIKKKGEELETKLLGPMLVMLVLVLVLILIPATSGFQIAM